MDELQFTWDPTKAAANLSKHTVSFEDASSVFRNPLARVLPDPTHSEHERRLLIIGHSVAGRLLLVVLRSQTTVSGSSAPDRHRRASVAKMKNTRRPRPSTKDVDMPAEYQLDWSKAKPNPYAARLKDTVAVVLAPDVAEVFPTSASVNTFLRSVIATMPRPGRKSARTTRRRKGGLTMKE